MLAVRAHAAILFLGNIEIREDVVESAKGAKLPVNLAEVGPHGLDVHQANTLPMRRPATSNKR